MSSRAKQASVAVVLLLILQLGAWAAYLTVQSRRESSKTPALDYTPLEHERVADIRLARMDGGTFVLPAHAREAAVVHFWATWCGPCRTELPGLLAIERPRVYAVSVDSNWAAVRRFFPNSVPANVFLDPNRSVARSFGVSTLPDSYLVNGGRIVGRLRGPQDWRNALVHALLQRVLGARALIP